MSGFVKIINVALDNITKLVGVTPDSMEKVFGLPPAGDGGEG